MIWLLVHGASADMLGLVPSFFSEDDPRPAREQIAARYISGWHPLPGFTVSDADGSLLYPGDPPVPVLAATQLRDEHIRFYAYSWLAIIQPDGALEVGRVD
jgi:hypothetical protein